MEVFGGCFGLFDEDLSVFFLGAGFWTNLEERREKNGWCCV